MNWDYFDKFEPLNDIYLPPRGEGDTLATQIVTAVNKIIYKFYNDGDVFDNTYYLKGWANDLSSYANWLYKYIDESAPILDRIETTRTENEYEKLLMDLADALLDEEFLNEMNQSPKTGSVYDCDGPFEFDEYREDEYDDDKDYY